MPLYLCSTTSKYRLIFYQKRKLSSIKPLSVSSFRLLHLLLPSLFLPSSFILFLSFFIFLSPLSFFLSSPDLLSKILPLFFFFFKPPSPFFLSLLPLFRFWLPPLPVMLSLLQKKRPLPITASPPFSLFLIFLILFFYFFNVLLSSKDKKQ